MPPYDDPTDAGAPAPDETRSDQQGYTCFLPGDFPGAENLKAGDTLTLKVVGKDKDGDIEVQHMPEDGEEESSDQGMMSNFDKEVGNK